jgi:hypothetical protein
VRCFNGVGVDDQGGFGVKDGLTGFRILNFGCMSASEVLMLLTRTALESKTAQ